MKRNTRTFFQYVSLLCFLIIFSSVSLLALTVDSTPPPQNLRIFATFGEDRKLSSLSFEYTDPREFTELLSLRYENGSYLYGYKLCYRWKIDGSEWSEVTDRDYKTFASFRPMVNSHEIFSSGDENSPLATILSTADITASTLSIEVKYIICSLSDGIVAESEFSSTAVIDLGADTVAKDVLLEDGAVAKLDDISLRGNTEDGYYINFTAHHDDSIWSLLTQSCSRIWFSAEAKIGDGEWINISCHPLGDAASNSKFTLELPSFGEDISSKQIHIRVQYLQYSNGTNELDLLKEGTYSQIYTYPSSAPQSDEPSSIPDADSGDAPSPVREFRLKGAIFGTVAILLAVFAALAILSLRRSKDNRK